MTDKSADRLAKEAEAKDLGIKNAHAMGDEKLDARIAEAKAAQVTKDAKPAKTSAAGVKDAPAGGDASGPVVRVVGPKKGRWRAGQHFGSEPVDIPVEELSEAQRKALEDDPLLIVSTVPAAAD